MSVQTKLVDDFKCQCQGGLCEGAILTEEISGDPRVIVETCGCIFRMSHLGRLMGAKLPEKIVEWFQRGQPLTRGFVCPQRDGKIADSFGVNDIITDQGRYMTLWEKANKQPNASFQDLTENPNLIARFSALPSPALGAILSEANREGKSPGQMDRKNALSGRILACSHEQWGLFRKLSFMVRATYHVSLAFFMGYGITFLRWGNFVSTEEQQEMLLRDVGERVCPLFLEYHGFRYNPEDYPSRTIEARLWNWILRR
ncbi:MAG: hypothetical protein H7A38_01690 [Chlamydiales bacterium]|nr:hypothetical protein [Chlamydiales bacterium]